MRTFLSLNGASLAVVLASGGASIASAHPANGADAVDARWNASLSRNGIVIPFRLDISGSGRALKGTLYDGFEPDDGTTSATFQNGKLVLNIEHYLTTITATEIPLETPSSKGERVAAKIEQLLAEKTAAGSAAPRAKSASGTLARSGGAY
jgi:hypothetical protein